MPEDRDPDKVGATAQVDRAARRLRDLALLVRANEARRCVHVKTNGLRCGSPAMRGNPFCFFDERWYNQPVEDTFPPLEDTNGVQLALMQVAERLRREVFRAGSLDPRLVKPLIFALKVAGMNARHTSFDSVGFRDRFVTDRPVEPIPAVELGKPPRSERESDGEDQARRG
jgi:hypothetical protein